MFQDQDRVEFRARNGIQVIGIIVGMQYKRCRKRPPYYEYTVSPEEGGKLGGFYRVPEFLLKKVGRAQRKTADKARKTVWDLKSKIFDQDQKRKEKNRDLLDKVSIQVGDTVLIRGKSSWSNWEAEVGAINPRNGRIGLVRMYNTRSSSSYDPLEGLGLLRRRKPREFRWIDPTCVIKKVKE